MLMSRLGLWQLRRRTGFNSHSTRAYLGLQSHGASDRGPGTFCGQWSHSLAAGKGGDSKVGSLWHMLSRRAGDMTDPKPRKA